jgi:hypothetical protein
MRRDDDAPSGPAPASGPPRAAPGGLAPAWWIAAGVVVAGLAAIRAGFFLDDEGILSWIFAGVMSEAPLDVLFFLKARPPISALYAPVAALGLTPFLCVHVVVAASAIPLTASLARRFGHRHPTLPAALVASSPLFFASAASGVQNSDAMVGVAFVAWLVTRDRCLAAGVVAALLLVARVETAIFVAAIGAFAVLKLGDRRFLLGALATLLVFLVLGATYHGDLSWPLRYPSSVRSNEAIDAAHRAAYGGTVGDLAVAILCLTPVAVVALWTPARARPAFEAVLILAAFVFVAAIRLLPFTNLVYVDASPRYLLPALPFLCLAIGNAVEHRGGLSWADAPRLAAGMLLAAAAASTLDWFPAIVVAIGIAGCLAATVAAATAKRVSIATLLVVAALAAPALVPRTRMFLGHEARLLDELVRWIEDAGVPAGATVVTDYPLLNVWRERHAPQLDVDVRFLAAPDMVYEVTTLTNPATRQRERLFGTKRFAYAPWIMVEDVRALPGDVYFVLRRRDSRRQDLDDPPFDQVEWLVEKDWRAGRLRLR